MKIRYSKKAIKFLQKIGSKQAQRIRDAILGLTEKPPVGDIKPLSGTSDSFRLRVGAYRVIYRYGYEGEIEVLLIDDIGNRGDVYK